jgi:hypothetical protein
VATSSAATLTVNVAPAITTQPVSQAANLGGSVSFTVAATGTASLSYQWRLNGVNVAGATSATLALTGIATNQSGTYTCLVTNVAGAATSSGATLTVNVPPTIATQPVSQTVTAGGNVSFIVAASGTAPLSYQWRRNGANVAGATSATLALTSVTTNQAGSYNCVVSNVAGSATSSAATLTVSPAPIAPTITTQPVSQSVTAGANVTFTVAASGTAPLAYQWRRNGVNVAGATAPTLTLNSVTTNSAGSYTCTVTNVAGSATSSAAMLTVQPAAPQTSTLTVVKQGQGTLAPDLNAATLTIGQSYTMTATPAAGYVFGGWSAQTPTQPTAPVTSLPTVTFTMTSNLVLTASFVADPFTAAAGVYNGLFTEADEVRLRSAGAFNVTASSSGSYSGWVQMGYTRYRLSGVLSSSLQATNVIARWGAAPLTVELQLGANATAGQISGRVTDGVWSSDLAGGRPSGSSAFAGDYTVAIPGAVGDPRISAGDSYATLHVAADGLGTMSGTLADGTQFLQSAYVTEDGDWPLYVSLYVARGAVVSWLNFTDLETSDVSGNLAWIKQAGASAVNYPAGFTNETKAVGSRYVAPTAAGKALNLSSGTVSFSGGSLSADFGNTFSVNAGSHVVNLSPNSMTLTIATGTGTFAGQVTDPESGAVRVFGGVLLQKQNAGFGFLNGGNNVSSRVVISGP